MEGEGDKTQEGQARMREKKGGGEDQRVEREGEKR